MNIEKYLTTKKNIVFILESPEKMDYLVDTAFHNIGSSGNFAFSLPIDTALNLHPSITLVSSFLHQLQEQTAVPFTFSRLFAWIASLLNGVHQMNQAFNIVVTETLQVLTLDQLQEFLSRNNEIIRNQISYLCSGSRDSILILIVPSYQQINQGQQPEVASILHRLTKGNRVYFKVFSLGEPKMFYRDNYCEVGIQARHDYFEVYENES